MSPFHHFMFFMRGAFPEAKVLEVWMTTQSYNIVYLQGDSLYVNYYQVCKGQPSHHAFTWCISWRFLFQAINSSWEMGEQFEENPDQLKLVIFWLLFEVRILYELDPSTLHSFFMWRGPAPLLHTFQHRLFLAEMLFWCQLFFSPQQQWNLDALRAVAIWTWHCHTWASSPSRLYVILTNVAPESMTAASLISKKCYFWGIIWDSKHHCSSWQPNILFSQDILWYPQTIQEVVTETIS